MPCRGKGWNHGDTDLCLQIRHIPISNTGYILEEQASMRADCTTIEDENLSHDKYVWTCMINYHNHNNNHTITINSI